jgi:hypothetical protein
LGRGSRLEGRNPSWHQEGIPLIRKRAAAAVGGIYGNDAVEAMYPLTRVTADGETIDTGKHNYTITLAAGQFPPVNAFWSVTMYDGENQLLIENPINRYSSPDGSVTMQIQKDSPHDAAVLALRDSAVDLAARSGNLDPRVYLTQILNTRKELVGARRFELPTPCTPCKCATRLRHAPTGCES